MYHQGFFKPPGFIHDTEPGEGFYLNNKFPNLFINFLFTILYIVYTCRLFRQWCFNLIQVFVGTSGWLYDWNEEASFDWYVKYSGLNAVELNASFYRFPFRNQIKSWSSKGSNLRWSIKVHRSITHFHRMKKTALDIWWKFYKLFEPLDKYIDFYLFQLPPNYVCKDSNLDNISMFNKEISLNERMAIEFRHSSCFNNRIVEWSCRNNITLVSIDAPIANWIVKSINTIYLRLHGREYWYGYEYSDKELREIVYKTIDLNPEKIYVFFNNNHWMLENARLVMDIYRETLGVN